MYCLKAKHTRPIGLGEPWTSKIPGLYRKLTNAKPNPESKLIPNPKRLFITLIELIAFLGSVCFLRHVYHIAQNGQINLFQFRFQPRSNRPQILENRTVLRFCNDVCISKFSGECML